MGALYESYKMVEDNKEQTVQTISSREVAEMMEVEHKNLLRKIDEINKDFDGSKVSCQKYWIESSFENRGKQYREYQITKRGCEFLAHKSTGTKGNLFTDRYMDKFEAMEKALKELDKPSYMIEDPIERAKKWIKEQEEKQELQNKLEKNSKMLNQISASKNSLLVREVAKILSNKHGITIGEKKLYQKLRDWGWVMKNSTEARQEAIERGYLEVREGTIEKACKVFTFHTTRVTGKGQRKILEKLLEEAEVKNECANVTDAVKK